MPHSDEPTSGLAAVAGSVPNAVRSETATYSELRPIPELTRKQLLRFESKIVEDEEGCWRWTGTKNHGRPYFKIGPHGYFAHRVMFAETFGRNGISASLAARTCGHVDCVNPDHIAPSDEQGLADVRKRCGAYAPWAGKRAGEANPNARFSDEEITAMIEAPGSLVEVGKRFGASPGYVWRVKTGRSRAQGIETRSAEIAQQAPSEG